MSIGLSFWLAKRNRDRWVRLHARDDIRRRMRQQYCDHSRRGKGNKAWKRVAAFGKDPFTIVWPDYAL